jgi:hypothetical protein
MRIRSLLSLCIVGAAGSLAGPALADVPNPTGSGGGTATGSVLDPNCTVSLQSTNGRTCQECDPTGSNCNFGSDYHAFCSRTAHAQVWCNGPVPDMPQDQNVSCTVKSPGHDGGDPQTPGAWGGAAAGALALVAALSMIRRRR